MSIEFKADFNAYFTKCYDEFKGALDNFQNYLQEMNLLFRQINLSTFEDEIISKFNNLLSKLKISLSKIKSFSKDSDSNLRSFSEIENDFSQLNYWYQNLAERNELRQKDFEFFKVLLAKLNNISSQALEFDHEKFHKLYYKYIGNSIRGNVKSSIMKNPIVIGALVTSITAVILWFLNTLILKLF